MDDQLDEELKNRIKKVFDEYTDPSADEGWSLLREKFPEEKANRRAIIWWWSAAAVLLLMLGFGVWKYAADNQAGNLAAVKQPKPALHENLASAKPSPAKTIAPQLAATHTNTTTVVKKQGQSDLRQASITNVDRKHAPYTAPQQRLIMPYTPPIVNSNATNGQLLASKTADTVKYAINQPAANQLAAAKTDSAKNILNQQPPVSQLAAIQPGNHAAKVDTTVKPKSIAEMFAKNDKPHEQIKDRTGLLRFGIFAGSYVNYARGSSNQSNVGGGFSAELRITKRLKLVSGVAVAGNTLNYGGGIPTTAAQSNFFNISNVPGVAASPGPSNFSINAASEVTSAASPAFKNYGVSMVGIDIPLNLKYDFDPKNFSLYFMTGLSSGTFVNETYTYQYNYPAISSPLLQQTHNESSSKSFNGFYFGRMLNLAIGFGYPVGNNRLILEPFLKYPLDGLGSQNLRFGAGGINLKFNFPTLGK